ncbi:type 1 glutamine amidotransferase [Nocardiopsis sp. EMB25]|uniref:type 1 glutamine amidotransferase n=1 Tax=Nocardiopsis TaxID=2013 RepID=UPI00034AA392|nr:MULTISPECIES: type 1 glutamine amidotransferase [Nocardiopsis]MCY9784254.1 type 1 glutamine amidotransferase [Nocardiopsis sp. EMB25]
MRALIVVHEHITEPGQVGERLAERGYEPTVLRVVPEERFDSPDVAFDFPDPRGWDVVVPMGSPWSVYDERTVGSWIGGEIALVRKAHEMGVPVLGICFGAQVLAAATGGSVEPAPRPEIGWTEIDTDDPALVGPGPWLEWHYDRCVPPPGAVELARTAVGPQAFRLGRSLGLQFHPEATARMVRGWLEAGGAAQCESRGIDPAALLDRTISLEAEAGERARALVDAFLDRVASG